MKKFFQKSFLLILLAFGGIHAAHADYTSADSYDGYFQFQKTKLTLDQHWVSWTFPNYDYYGTDDALIHSRWYVGGNKAGYDTYITNPKTYFFTPFWQGAEILYMSRTYGITQRQNEEYGVGNVFDERRDGDIRLHDIKFYPGELMGPTQMNYFFVRWTGYWDINDNDNNKGYWIGQPQGAIGNSADGAAWQGPGIKHRGNGIARYVQVTYEIPQTIAATLTRRPGGHIEASISGNNHGSWDEYYGFSNNEDTDGYGYYTNAYGTTALSNSDGKATYTLTDSKNNAVKFNETESYTIYYHHFYKLSQTIS